jgi:nucleotide-binding universal stress UspA family protein
MPGILIPVDFTGCAERSCHLGVKLAVKLGQPVHLLYCFSPDTKMPANPEMDNACATKEEAVAKLQDIRSFLLSKADKSSAVPEIFTHLVTGKPVKAVTDFASELNPSLIIITSHNKNDRVKRIFGSRSFYIIRTVSAPVLSIPGEVEISLDGLIRIGYIVQDPLKSNNDLKQLHDLLKSFNTNLTMIGFRPFDLTEDLPDVKSKHEHSGSYTDPFDVTITGPDLIDGLQDVLQTNGFDLLSVTLSQRRIFAGFSTPAMIRHLYYELDIPFLVFHRK